MKRLRGRARRPPAPAPAPPGSAAAVAAQVLGGVSVAADAMETMRDDVLTYVRVGGLGPEVDREVVTLLERIATAATEAAAALRAAGGSR